MYGTVARLRVKAGSEDASQRLNDEYAQGIPGPVSEVVYRAAAAGREY